MGDCNKDAGSDLQLLLIIDQVCVYSLTPMNLSCWCLCVCVDETHSEAASTAHRHPLLIIRHLQHKQDNTDWEHSDQTAPDPDPDPAAPDPAAAAPDPSAAAHDPDPDPTTAGAPEPDPEPAPDPAAGAPDPAPAAAPASFSCLCLLLLLLFMLLHQRLKLLIQTAVFCLFKHLIIHSFVDKQTFLDQLEFQVNVSRM